MSQSTTIVIDPPSGQDGMSVTASATAEQPITVVPSNVLTDTEAAEVRQALRDGQLGDYGLELAEWHAAVDGDPYATAYGRRRMAERAKRVA